MKNHMQISKLKNFSNSVSDLKLESKNKNLIICQNLYYVFVCSFLYHACRRSARSDARFARIVIVASCACCAEAVAKRHEWREQRGALACVAWRGARANRAERGRRVGRLRRIVSCARRLATLCWPVYARAAPRRQCAPQRRTSQRSCTSARDCC